MRSFGWVICGLALALFAGCDRLPALGGEGQPCFDNGTCQGELTCTDAEICCPTPCTPGLDRCLNTQTLISCLPDDATGCPAETEVTCEHGCAEDMCQDACVKDCTDRVCGPDPNCDQSCGTCPGSQSCTVGGQCTDCVPQCGTRVCGPDPVCQVSCGNCDTGDNCIDGQCCCTVDASACVGAEVKTCDDPDHDGCGTWSTPAMCPNGLDCNPTTGACPGDCTDECLGEGQLCDGNFSRECGYYDADTCLDWNVEKQECSLPAICAVGFGCCTPDCGNACDVVTATSCGQMCECRVGQRCESNLCVNETPTFQGFSVGNCGAGTHWLEVTASFSEPVRGVAGGVAVGPIESGVYLTRFRAEDGGSTWKFLVIGLYHGLDVQLTLDPDKVTDLDGAQVLPGGFDTVSISCSGTNPLYVSTSGDDGSTGSNATSALATIYEAARRIRAGETPAREILVAAGTYNECVELPADIGLLGGFDGSFGARDLGSARPLLGCNTAGSVSAILFETPGSGTGEQTLVDGFELLVYQVGGEPRAVVDMSETAGVLSRSQVQAFSNFGIAGSCGVRTLTGAAKILDNLIDGSQTDLSDAVGLEVGAGAAPEVYGNTFTGCAGGDVYTLFGVRSAGAAILDGNAFAPLPDCEFPFTAVNLTGAGAADALVANNRIFLGGTNPTSRSIGVALEGSSRAALIGNTIWAASGRAVTMQSVHARLVNNILLCNGIANWTAVDELDDFAVPASVLHNLFLSTANVYHGYGQNPSGYGTVAAMEDGLDGASVDKTCEGPTCETTRASGNRSASAPDEIFDHFDPTDWSANRWHLEAASDFAGAGYNLAGPCGTYQDISTPCSTLGTDADGALRTAPVSIGAYEQDN